MTSREDRIYTRVECAIQNACEGGYADDIAGFSDEQLAQDLQLYDADLERESLEDILAAVRRFRAAKAA